jgi:hypothetical protein
MKYICFGISRARKKGMTEDERLATFDDCFEYNDHMRANGHLVAAASFLSLRCAARRPAAARNHSFAPLPSTYPFSAQARLGPCWANFTTRLTALSVGAMGWNARSGFLS